MYTFKSTIVLLALASMAASAQAKARAQATVDRELRELVDRMDVEADVIFGAKAEWGAAVVSWADPSGAQIKKEEDLRRRWNGSGTVTGLLGLYGRVQRLLTSGDLDPRRLKDAELLEQRARGAVNRAYTAVYGRDYVVPGAPIMNARLSGQPIGPDQRSAKAGNKRKKGKERGKQVARGAVLHRANPGGGNRYNQKLRSRHKRLLW